MSARAASTPRPSRCDRVERQRRSASRVASRASRLVRRPARRARADRHQGRLQRRRLRRLHGPARRPTGVRLPGRASAQVEGRAVTDRRGPGADGELDRLQRAFLAHGAAQCGICTPGHADGRAPICSRAIRDPSEPRCCDALGGVLCRCTGYRKIVEAVLAAARGDGGARRSPAVGAAVGARAPKIDGVAEGHRRPSATAPTPARRRALAARGPLAARARRASSIGDLRAAASPRTPGSPTCITARDVPVNRFGIFPDVKDQPVLADGRVRFRGEAVLGLVGETHGGAADPRRRDCRSAGRRRRRRPRSRTALAHVGDPLHARNPGQRPDPRARGEGRRRRGARARRRTRRARASSRPASSSTRTSSPRRATPSAIGRAHPDLRLHPDAVHGPRRDRARPRHRPEPRCTSCRRPSAAASAASSTSRSSRCSRSRPGSSDRPVRGVYTRPESMASTTKRHPARMRATLRVRRRRALVAADFFGDFNTGAYASWGNTVANRVPIHASRSVRRAERPRADPRRLHQRTDRAARSAASACRSRRSSTRRCSTSWRSRPASTGWSSGIATRSAPGRRRRPGRC